MNDNPWHRLPVSSPFVLPEEKQAVQEFNRTADEKHHLRIDDVLPEAFVGCQDAPVVLLGNNPGLSEKGLPLKQNPTFRKRMRDNLLHRPSKYPFVFLDPEFSGPSQHWWESKLRHLLERFGPTTVANSVLAVEYFPYPSRRFRHGGLHLPSQDYNFHLVRKAIKRGPVIILMRGKQRWLKAVPKLDGYDRLLSLTNLQQPTISPGNCPRFEEVVQAVEEAHRRKRSC